MHSRNPYIAGYNFNELVDGYPAFAKAILTKPDGTLSIDFGHRDAVFLLNAALLHVYHGVSAYFIPDQYLVPPVPGRLDYLLHLQDLFSDKKSLVGLDIGTGANAIYPILAASLGWTIKGVDVDKKAVEIARENCTFSKAITIALQPDRGNILKGAIQAHETYDFVMCNPPFYDSKNTAEKMFLRKQKNLKLDGTARNFSGTDSELYCNGGEALFVKRMIKESVHFKHQVTRFSSLLSHSKNCIKLGKQLDKLNATHQKLAVSHGNKKSTILVWYWDKGY